MEKIDKRINYRIVLDVESCPIEPSEKVEPSNMLTYDIGWAVVDKRGTVYLSRSFVVGEIFMGEKDRMRSAYYADKIPQYYADLEKGSRVMLPLAIIRKIFREDAKTYRVSEFYAHNMRFDYGSLKATMKWVLPEEKPYFFPYGAIICDTLKMSRDVVGKMPTYKQFTKENGFTTKQGQPRLTAEVLYRFITKKTEFTESHTGLEDVLIEKEILSYCFKQHKKMRRTLWDN